MQHQHQDLYYKQGPYPQYHGYLTTAVAARTQGRPQHSGLTYNNSQINSVENVKSLLKSNQDLSSYGKRPATSANESKSPTKKTKVSKPSCYSSDSSKIASTLTAMGKFQTGEVTVTLASAGSKISSRPASPPRRKTASSKNVSLLSRSAEHAKTVKGDRSSSDKRKNTSAIHDSEDDFHKDLNRKTRKW